MKVAMKGILLSAFLVFSAGAVAQGANGGAAGGQGGTGMSKPNTEGTTGTVSGASGANTMAPTTGTHKKMHKKSGAAMPASATNPGSGGS